jgi:SAM-dependent methyltransferase
MEPKQEKNDDFWRKFWLEPIQAWDQNGPHPHLKRTLEAAIDRGQLQEGGRIFAPGCGRAHSEAVLAKLGYQVTAADFVQEALDKAKAFHGELVGLNFVNQDVLKPGQDEQGYYDGIFDRAFFCAIPPPLRKTFVESCHYRLKPGGLFMSLTFTMIAPDIKGPPFAIKLDEIHHLFANDFTLVFAETNSSIQENSKIKEELINIWQKK